jgi:NDP-sugar pyrophosphorylase family protein
MAFHEKGKQKATMAVRRYYHHVPFGCLATEDDRVLRLEEKPTLTQIINAGIYVFSPELVSDVPKNQEFPLTKLIEKCIDREDLVRAYEIEEDWIDIGQADQLKQARGEH